MAFRWKMFQLAAHSQQWGQFREKNVLEENLPWQPRTTLPSLHSSAPPSVSVHLTWLFTIGLEPMKPRNLLFQHLAYAHVMPACHLSPSADFGNFYPGKLFPITFRITWGMKFSVFKYAFLPVGGETQSISQEVADFAPCPVLTRNPHIDWKMWSLCVPSVALHPSLAVWTSKLVHDIKIFVWMEWTIIYCF